MAPRRTHAAYLKKAPSPTQTAFAAWIEKTTGHAVPAGDVALVQRLYPLYLKTDEVVKAREEAAEARRKAEETKAAQKREKAQARLIELERQRFALMQELGMEPEGQVPDLSVVPATVGEAGLPPEPSEAEELAERVGLVLGESSDEFVEPEDEEPEADEPEDDDLWDEDDDDEEDF